MSTEHLTPMKPAGRSPAPLCTPLRYILSVSEGHHETDPRVEAYILWLTLGSPGPSYSEWIKDVAPEGVDLKAAGPAMLTWKDALLITTTTGNQAGRRARRTFQHPETGPAVMLRLLGLAKGEASPSA